MLHGEAELDVWIVGSALLAVLITGSGQSGARADGHVDVAGVAIDVHGTLQNYSSFCLMSSMHCPRASLQLWSSLTNPLRSVALCCRGKDSKVVACPNSPWQLFIDVF